MPNTKEQIAAAIEVALDHVYPDVDALLHQATREFAVSNMGQECKDFLQYGVLSPDRLFESAWGSFYQSSESDEMASALDDERKSWVKLLKPTAKAIAKAGEPLTVRNLRDSFMKHRFEKKKK